MPRVVDHEQRRQQLTEAVWRITALRGLEAVSLRSVAAEAGVSMGTVQHYFASKDRMIQFACRRIVDQAISGGQGLIDQAEDPQDPRVVIRAVMQQTLPLNDHQRRVSAVWLAFVTRAVVDEELAAFIRQAWRGLHDFVAGQLRRARDGGEVPKHVDIDREAVALVTLADGLVPHLLVDQFSNEAALAVIDHHLDRLFAP